MTGYRAYKPDAQGHVLSRLAFEVADEAAALSHGRREMTDRDLEVWQLHRMVGRLRVEDQQAA